MNNAKNPARAGIVLGGLALIVGSIIWACGSTNFETPAGYVGYIREGSIFGKTKFVGTQTGPTSSGKHWLYTGNNVCVTPYTENEQWSQADGVLAKDKLSIILSAHLTWRLKPDKIQDFMEHYGGWDEHAPADQLEQSAYNHFIKQPFRNLVRDEISKYEGLEINEHLPQIAGEIQDQLARRFKDTPFEIISAVIGTCVPPVNVTEQIAKKVASKQELERKTTELEIALKQEAIKAAEGKAMAAQDVEEAKGRALAMKAIKEQLTPEYLSYEAIRGFAGANRIYIPLGANGLPIVGNLNIEKEKEK